MNEQQLVAAARELCRLRGIDPEARVAHTADPTPNGSVPMALLYSPAWVRAVREIQNHSLLNQAIAHGMQTP